MAHVIFGLELALVVGLIIMSAAPESRSSRLRWWACLTLSTALIALAFHYAFPNRPESIEWQVARGFTVIATLFIAIMGSYQEELARQDVA